MTGIYNINYKGTDYPAADITIFGNQEATVSTTDLEKALMQDEAYNIDEKICYYLEPEEMNLPDEEVAAIIEKSYE